VGRTYYVSHDGLHVSPYTNWLFAATNIAAALRLASDSDTVLVTNGLYTVVPTLAVTQAVYLVSANGAPVTVLDGFGANRCVYMEHTNAVVEGFTVQNGHVAVGFPSTGGGGICCLGGTVRQCTIRYNTVLGDSVWGDGGGIRSVGLIQQCVLYSNQCVRGTGGGASIGGEGTIEDSLIEGNQADSAGGLVLLGGGSARRCRVRGNLGTIGSGGISALTAADIENCAVTENSGESGGGIVVQIGQPMMGEAPGVRIANTTISANEAPRCGGLLVLGVETGCVDVANSIIHGNTGLNYSNSVGLCSYAHTCTFPLVPGIGNITNDPQLTPSYRLKSTSPCIDAGMASNAPLTDIDGEARWDDPRHSNIVSVVDIGADEFVDADLDDMADYWETENFGGMTNSNGIADDDGDGLTDLGEYENSTDPGNADTDADQMPDGWEVGNALDPLADDAGEDPDTDTMGNRGEYIADTDPRNPDSVLSVTDIAAELGGIRIDWKGGRQAWQFLECRGDLITNAPWIPILAVPPPSPLTNAIIDFGNTNQTLFYRIRAER